ncbi:hypothetical protein TREES_T100005405, partial [Tupaia chinensis]
SATAPTTSSAPCPSNHPTQEHFILAFFAGVLMTLLLVALVVLIIKSYKKCHSTPQASDPHSDPPAKISPIPEESLTYASMIFKTTEENSHLTKSQSADMDPVVYAPIKLAHSPCLSSEA